MNCARAIQVPYRMRINITYAISAKLKNLIIYIIRILITIRLRSTNDLIEISNIVDYII